MTGGPKKSIHMIFVRNQIDLSVLENRKDVVFQPA